MNIYPFLIAVLLVTGIACLVLSVALLFLWDTPTLRRELSGKNRQRRIEKINRAIKTNGTVSTTDLYNQDFNDVLTNNDIRAVISSKDEKGTGESTETYDSTTTSGNFADVVAQEYNIGFDDQGSGVLSTGVFEEDSSILADYNPKDPFLAVRSSLTLFERSSLTS